MLSLEHKEGVSNFVFYKNIESIKINKSIRSQLNWRSIRKLATSIKVFGILQPLLINQDNELILGLRRYYAAKFVGILEVPVIVTPTDATGLEKQLVSDLNTKHLTVVERALAFHDLMEKKDLTKYRLAKYLGFSHNLICRTLAILKANPRTMHLLKDEKISQKTVATVLYCLKNKRFENYVINKIIRDKLNIVQAGNLVAELNNPEIMKKHFIIKIKSFRTTIEKFKEKIIQVNLSANEKKEIKTEINLIKELIDNL